MRREGRRGGNQPPPPPPTIGRLNPVENEAVVAAALSATVRARLAGQEWHGSCARLDMERSTKWKQHPSDREYSFDVHVLFPKDVPEGRKYFEQIVGRNVRLQWNRKVTIEHVSDLIHNMQDQLESFKML